MNIKKNVLLQSEFTFHPQKVIYIYSLVANVFDTIATALVGESLNNARRRRNFLVFRNIYLLKHSAFLSNKDSVH